MTSALTRRVALAILASAAASPVGAAAPLRFRAIEVDVSPMRAKGDTITAQWLAKDLPDLLRKAFADYLAPGDRGAPLLVARVDSVSYGTAGSSMQAFTSTTDFIEGAAVVKFADGKQTVYPITANCGVGAPLIDTPNGGELRVLALAGVYARFLPGQMGL